MDVQRDLSQPEGFDNPLKRTRLDRGHRFLCGAAPGATSKTEENVVPKWLQNKFGLRNKRLLLPNGTSTPYRQLKIPRSADCNGGGLSAIEDKVRRAAEGGYSSLLRLDRLSV